MDFSAHADLQFGSGKTLKLTVIPAPEGRIEQQGSVQGVQFEAFVAWVKSNIDKSAVLPGKTQVAEEIADLSVFIATWKGNNNNVYRSFEFSTMVDLSLGDGLTAATLRSLTVFHSSETKKFELEATLDFCIPAKNDNELDRLMTFTGKLSKGKDIWTLDANWKGDDEEAGVHLADIARALGM
ncbi:hypothetical protein [Streptomyces chrestomyceticus]|uniref:hypothetical protein n=1 Tax=Streptomyces chrestomyceticus TaxID=68185 RepID=UPI0033E1E7A1